MKYALKTMNYQKRMICICIDSKLGSLNIILKYKVCCAVSNGFNDAVGFFNVS